MNTQASLPLDATDTTELPPPIVWSIAGTDSGGGAGLSADQRAADAFCVHLCPVVAAVTAQHSRAVTRVAPMPADLLEAQLAALAEDMPPAVIKTGLLGGSAQVKLVATWIDRLRATQAPVALVIDPVLAASSGASFADKATLRAYRELLLPRATLVVPNRREAAHLTGLDEAIPAPELARALLATGCQAVCITGGDSIDHEGLVLDWLATRHASGWLALPRVPTPHHHGTGCTFATSAAAALARGFVEADALVLAKMATAQALRHSRIAGQGAGPVVARGGFANDPSLMPLLSFGEAPRFDTRPVTSEPPLGLYAIVDKAERIPAVLDAGIRTLQLRIKTPADADATWHDALRASVRQAIALCREAGARLFVNDHWHLALELAAGDARIGVHLGQEDLHALGDEGRAALAGSGLALGVSSHSLWELARARSLAPAYIACGPVWPTLTKAMPWQPQGLHNLAWWCAMAGRPVVAIGGILQPEQVEAAAACGADGVCLVRALGDDPRRTVAPLQGLLNAGHAAAGWKPAPEWPRPSLHSDLVPTPSQED